MLLVSTKNQDTNVDVETVTKNPPPDVLTSMNVKPMQKVNVQQHCVIIVLIKFSNFFVTVREPRTEKLVRADQAIRSGSHIPGKQFRNLISN